MRTGVQAAKEALKLQILGTCRGGAASALQRGQVAEAQANLESLGQGIQIADLQGLWRLIYTTAPDVVCAGLGAACTAQKRGREYWCQALLWCRDRFWLQAAQRSSPASFRCRLATSTSASRPRRRD